MLFILLLCQVRVNLSNFGHSGALLFLRETPFIVTNTNYSQIPIPLTGYLQTDDQTQFSLSERLGLRGTQSCLLPDITSSGWSVPDADATAYRGS